MATHRFSKGEYFRWELSVNNSSAPAWEQVTVSATDEPTVTGRRFVPRTPEQFTYDADGNMTSDGRWNFSWDAENRLVTLVARTGVGPQQSIRFDYDAQGRRIRKRVWNNLTFTGTPIVDQRFVYDGWNLIAEVGPSGSPVRSYVWGLDLSGSLQGAGGVGGLLQVSYYGTQTTNCFVAYDGNGNVTALVNAADGKAVAQYEYGPFGEVLRASGPMARLNPKGFSTKYQGAETDLLYYGYRYYNASMGRWLNRDPIGERGGVNLYGFVLNNPASNSDPDGRLTIKNCTPDEQADIQSALLALNMNIVPTVRAGFTCCFGESATRHIDRRLNWQNFIVECRDCSDCGFAGPGKIVLCRPHAWSNPNCGSLSCTLLHELVHLANFPFAGERKACIAEKCYGCPRTPACDKYWDTLPNP